MWAVNLTEYCRKQYSYSPTGWAPADAYLEAVWGFFSELNGALDDATETLIGQDKAELRALLEAKYLVPESSFCTRVGHDKTDGRIYVPGKGNVDGCVVSQYPVYTGMNWEEALSLAERLPKLLVPSALVPVECEPQDGRIVTAFDGAYGCTASRAKDYLFLWHDPARALRILKRRARQETGLWKPRKPSVDYYRLLMECLRAVVGEHMETFRMPRRYKAVLKLEEIDFRVVGTRSQYKDDPAHVMTWVLHCHSLYRRLDIGAFRRLGKMNYYCGWQKPRMTYRKAIRTLVRDEVRIRASTRKHFKLRGWTPFFAWVKREARRLKTKPAERKKPAVEDQQIAA